MVNNFIWRDLKLKLPTNENIENIGVEPIKCYCCRNKGWDDVDHIFIYGIFAQHILKYLDNFMGISIQQSSLSNMLIQWCKTTGKNEAHRTIINI